MKPYAETGTWVPLMSEFGGESRFGFFRTQEVQSTTLGPRMKVGYLGVADVRVRPVEPFQILSHNMSIPLL